MERIDAFPTQIWVDTTDNIDNKTLAKFILNKQKTTDNMNMDDLRSAICVGWQSNPELYKDFFEEISDTIGKLDCLIKKMTKEIVVYNEYKKDIQIRYQGMWANINGYKDYIKPHVHPECDWSGVYYVKLPENCGLIWFADPRPVRHMLIRENLWGSMPRLGCTAPRDIATQMTVSPEVSTLVMFPSFLEHFVDPNESHEPRISISFNLSFN